MRTYRWDQNPGDLERNRGFALALLDDLQSRYRLDPARLYAAGFSSGTNMAAQLLDGDGGVAGFGFVGGGVWNEPAIAALGGARAYAVTGYRDYMLRYQRALEEALAAADWQAGRIFVREVDTGHELYGWHFAE